MIKKNLELMDKFEELPVIPLRDIVVFPHMVTPLFVGREQSVAALEEAMLNEKKIVLVAQKNQDQDTPLADDLYKVGTKASILQVLRLPDGTIKVLVEGSNRVSIKTYLELDKYIAAALIPLETTIKDEEQDKIKSLERALIMQFESYIKLNRKIPTEILESFKTIKNAEQLCDAIVAQLQLKVTEKQGVLEQENLLNRLESLSDFVDSEIALLKVDRNVKSRVKRQIEKTQREYYLTEQMKAIQDELGQHGGGKGTDNLANKIKTANMSKEGEEKAMSELNKLKMMSPMSAEATVIRNYLDWMINLPWQKKSKITYNLVKATENLDKAHFGLEKVKERILEYLAVQKRVKKIKGAILCLVGPPGVGKTSLGQSIANATGRKFIRISLGGVRDEAEIRGHRRTYIGSMPGKIIQKLSKIKVNNPLIMLDEIDKMSMDFRGDPSSALLEALDPEQNSTFGDHYLEVDFDLSNIMFITTANSLEIPAPLLDRMEVIRLAGYTEDEKLNIANKYLITKQFKSNGIKKSELEITTEAVTSIIRYYTREAGVRNLERNIAKICRKAVYNIGNDNIKKKIIIDNKNLEDYLGVKKFRYGIAEKQNQIGAVTGLAWTSVGGEILTIEASKMTGDGKAVYTGKLGEVMQESIKAAMTFVRSNCKELGIKEDFNKKLDIHVHVPEGATPKDGPSAGIGMCTALVSILTDKPVRSDTAMTGEITLRGQVLPIGGLKEKVLAAHRGGIKQVIIPDENKRDLKEIPEKILKELKIIPVKNVTEVLKIAITK